MKKRAVFLGAGFSMAISPYFIDTDTLGTRVMQKIAESGTQLATSSQYTGRRFEAWLSRLAEPQPDLADTQNLLNKSAFLTITKTIRDAILECQEETPNSDPWWLRRFIGLLHHGGDTVITFNYDTLFEDALTRSGLFDTNSIRASAEAALRHMPMAAEIPSSGIKFGAPTASTLRLIKLHGSVDTFWVNDDDTGATIRRWGRSPSTMAPGESELDTRNHLLPARDPFIVPPAAAKSSYYRNPLTRQLWRDASEALRDPSEVAFVGYSIPSTDLVASNMIAERLNMNSAPISIVNPNPSEPLQTLLRLGIDKSRITAFDSCEEYVNKIEASLAFSILHDDPRIAALKRLEVGLGAYPQYRVTGSTMDSANNSIIMHTEALRTSDVRQGGDAISLIDAFKLVGPFEDGDDRPSVTIQYPTGEVAGAAFAFTGHSELNRDAPLIIQPTAIPNYPE